MQKFSHVLIYLVHVLLSLAGQSTGHLNMQTESSLEVVLFAVMALLLCYLGENKASSSSMSWNIPGDKGNYQSKRLPIRTWKHILDAHGIVK